MRNPPQSGKRNLGVFHVSCWVLGVLAFGQVMAIGTAMALRDQKRPEPRERIVKEYVMVPAERRAPVTVAPQKQTPLAEQVSAEEPIEVPDLEPLPKVHRDEVLAEAPAVLDPIVERLLEEAREARIKGDLILALTKFTDAGKEEPDNPHVLYGMGTTYEEFEVFDKAADYFLQVYQAGPEKAGSLWEKASIKLAHGLVPEVKDLAMLGWGRMTNPVQEAGGEKRTLILPVRVAPGKDFDPMLFTPRVRFYEKVDGQIDQAIINEGNSGSEWVTGKADWQDGEEMAEVWYFVPDQDPAMGLLVGQREFYGFVAELYYDGRLVDIRAQPRTLLQEGGGESAMKELRRELDELDGLTLEDLTAGPSLLPKIGDPLPEPDNSRAYGPEFPLEDE
jgi:hypothetical protein